MKLNLKKPKLDLKKPKLNLKMTPTKKMDVSKLASKKGKKMS